MYQQMTTETVRICTAYIYNQSVIGAEEPVNPLLKVTIFTAAIGRKTLS